MADSEKSKYPALRIIAAWYKAFGYLVGGIVFLAGAVALSKSGSTSVGFALIIGAAVFVVLSMAVAEIIQVFLDTENNTRSSAGYLRDLLELQQKNNTPATTPTPKPRKSPVKHNEPAKAASEDQAQSIRKLIRNLHNDGMSSTEIAQELKAEGMPTLDDTGNWSSKLVNDVLMQGQT